MIELKTTILILIEVQPSRLARRCPVSKNDQRSLKPVNEIDSTCIVVIYHLNMGKTMVMKAMNPPKQHAKRRES